MAVRSKARVCGRSFVGIAGSNPTGEHGYLSVVSVVCFSDGLSYRVCVCACVRVQLRATTTLYIYSGYVDRGTTTKDNTNSQYETSSNKNILVTTQCNQL